MKGDRKQGKGRIKPTNWNRESSSVDLDPVRELVEEEREEELPRPKATLTLDA